jgi:hypothetical protein
MESQKVNQLVAMMDTVKVGRLETWKVNCTVGMKDNQMVD